MFALIAVSVTGFRSQQPALPRVALKHLQLHVVIIQC